MTDFPAVSNTVIENEALLSIVPHGGKMLLLSRIMEYDVHQHMLCSEYDISEDCLFYDSALGGVPVWMSFEFMAQAVSALSGLTGKVLGRPPMVGFVLSVSSYEIKTQVLRPGEVARTRVSEELRVGMASTFRCTVCSGENEVSRGQLMLLDVEDTSLYLEKDSYGK